VVLGLGQEASDVLQDGPFTFSADCITINGDGPNGDDYVNGDDDLQLFAQSTDSFWAQPLTPWGGFQPVTLWSPGSVVDVFDTEGLTPGGTLLQTSPVVLLDQSSGDLYLVQVNWVPGTEATCAFSLAVSS
jgi:hypothetical protein